MTPTPYDQACRYLAKLEPPAFLAWLLDLPPDQLGFRGWLDARRLRFPGEPNRTCDTVAFLENVAEAGEPWAVPVEFQIEPDAEMFGRLLGYLSGLYLELRPSDNAGDRFRVGGVVVNLTGRGNSSRDMVWPAAGLATRLGVRERNLAAEDARATLDGIFAGTAPAVVLPLIPLMRGGGEQGIINDWLSRATAEPDSRRRSDYGGLALVFAEAAKRHEVWKKALEGWNVTESMQVKEWQAQALLRGRNEGREEGELIGRIRAYQEILALPIASVEELRQRSRDDLSRMADQLKGQLSPRANGHS
jgi:hypothetical protein